MRFLNALRFNRLVTSRNQKIQLFVGTFCLFVWQSKKWIFQIWKAVSRGLGFNILNIMFAWPLQLQSKSLNAFVKFWRFFCFVFFVKPNFIMRYNEILLASDTWDTNGNCLYNSSEKVWRVSAQTLSRVSKWKPAFFFFGGQNAQTSSLSASQLSKPNEAS